MTESGRQSLWCPAPGDFENLTPEKVRDLIIKCFFYAQKENFARAKEKLKTIADDKHILESVTNTVKITFTDVHEDFNKPTKAGLLLVIERLGKTATMMGTPGDIVEHHQQTIRRLMENL